MRSAGFLLGLGDVLTSIRLYFILTNLPQPHDRQKDGGSSKLQPLTQSVRGQFWDMLWPITRAREMVNRLSR